MKRLIKFLFVLLAILCFGISALPLRAAEPGEYSIKYIDGAFCLYSYTGGEESLIASASDVSEIFSDSYIPSSSSVVLCGIEIKKDIVIKDKTLVLKGSASFIDSNLIIESSDISLSDADINFSGAAEIRLKEGYLRIEDSVLKASSSAIRLDYSSEARLEIFGGRIEGNSYNGTVYASLGSVYISGGEIVNILGPAVKSASSLYLGGTAKLIGTSYDVESSVPINLTANGAPFQSGLRIKYLTEFSEGTLTPVLYKANKTSVENIRLFDLWGEEKALSFFESSKYTEERDFAAVYLPFTVSFRDGSETLCNKYVLLEERVEAYSASERIGYKFIGWETENGELYEFDGAPNADITLYARYELLAPEFSISSLEFTYDTYEHELSFLSLTHPLLEYGELSFLWYKNGKSVSASESLKIRDVSDSGEYICKIKFTHAGYEASVCTEPISVKINKYAVYLPEIPTAVYSGFKQSAAIFSTPLYKVECGEYINAGSYPVSFTLTDKENYQFFGFSDSSVSLDFNILPAENEWTGAPNVKNAYYGSSPCFSAIAKFGEVKFKFSSSYDGIYEESVPISVGTYYMRAEVAATANYWGLVSEPVEFYILEDGVLAVSVLEKPYKLEYKAFESFDADGCVLLVSYRSGKTKTVSGEDIEVTYPRGESLLFGDTGVVLSYGGKSVSLSIKCKKADYDVTGISFKDCEAVYDGSFKLIQPTGAFPIGKDGISLSYSVSGGGSAVGSYIMTLNFKSESENYNSPPPITATLKVVPLQREVFWEELSFVYDSTLKKPCAYIINESGAKIYLEVEGARSFAGKYTAKAICTDKNYTLLSDFSEYNILKADYELSGVYWSDSEFVYDGLEKSVLLLGLPPGVSVIGYTDNRASLAGSYLAKAVLSYDTNNYNPPMLDAFPWTVRRADYDCSGFSFVSEEAVYDGEIHYPTLEGSMPCGIDGSRLSYSFDKGALHVSEGRVAVTVSFHTDSKNYNAPGNITAFVTVKPKGIEVLWEERSFTYTGKPFAPKALASECKISVIGAASDVGTYNATALSENSDYYVINAKCEFNVNRAENSFTESFCVGNIYEGDEPSVFAATAGADVSYRFFKDEGLTEEISTPLAPGVYYAVAECSGGKNYTAIRSEALSFEVIALKPVAIYPELLKTEMRAFETLTPEDISVVLEYNSGKRVKLGFEDISIAYEKAEGLRATDSLVTVQAMGIAKQIPISVKKADIDLSNSYWTDGVFTYDGAEKSIYLLGLPDGVSVGSYTGNGVYLSGEYTVSASLIYDAENYNAPVVPNGDITIEKCRVEAPVIMPLTYSGKYMEISVVNSDFYNYSKNLYLNGGEYSVVFYLKDSKNYVFSETMSDSIEMRFRVLPRLASVKIYDTDVYLFEEVKNPHFETEGVLPGEDLMLEFKIDGDRIICESHNPNYEISFSEGRIVRHNTLSSDAYNVLFIFVLILLLITLLIVAFVHNRDKLRRIAVLSKGYKSKHRVDKSFKNTVLEITEEKEKALPPLIETKEEPLVELNESDCLPKINGSECGLSLDSERADMLLSDKMAKALVRRAESIETVGNKRRIINVGSINRAFSSGERVDINRMKSESLIPYDTAYIKVLADGIIDKPLKIYANDFSLSAVKMIALAGGEAVKVNTARVKMPRNRDE